MNGTSVFIKATFTPGTSEMVRTHSEEMAVYPSESRSPPGAAYDTMFILTFVGTWACTFGPESVH